ncbi:hypothetical protein ONA70_35040, partial [Micromonospora yasonensis]|nr:hypothetical protein [Micromonospora yasonensis]
MTLVEPATVAAPADHRSARPAPRRRRTRPVGAAATVAAIGVFAFGPVYWLLVTALTPNADAFAFPPRLWPETVTLEHFTNLADNPALARYLGNSLIVSLLTALLTVIVSAYTAYSFAKFRYRGRRSLMYLVLASQMFPQALLLITLYLV